MIIGRVTVTSPRMVDERRRIEEFNAETPDDFSVQIFDILSDAGPLGKHAHAQKSETFVIQEGGGRVITCIVNEVGEPINSVENHELERGSVVHIKPYEAHTFYLVPGTKMVCFSSRRFDEEDFIGCPFLV